jgi:hypothetical protein
VRPVLTAEVSQGYGGCVTVRRILLTFVAALLMGAAARPANAAGVRRQPHHHDHHHHHRPISAITLTPEGTGTLIRITYAGFARPLTRILRSQDPIDTLAVADVDNDGDLDILAAPKAGGLFLWRNAGGGHYVFACAIPPPRRTLTPAQRVLHPAIATSAPDQTGDERSSAAVARHRDAVAGLIEIPHVIRASSLLLSTFSVASRGRAPPPAVA